MDDHPIVREGIKHSLANKRRLRIVGEASDGLEAVHLASKLLPDVVLMDINMPTMSGTEAAEVMMKNNPNIKILALTMHDNREYVLRMAKIGVLGYLFKDDPPTELVKAIETVARGKTYFTHRASEHIVAEYKRASRRYSEGGPHGLSLQELRVLRALTNGLNMKQVAKECGISLRTAETYRSRIMAKLGIETIAGLTKFAIREGIIELK